MGANNKIYLTKQGLKAIQEEYKKLEKERQLKVQEESHKNNYYSNPDIEHSMFQEEMNYLNARLSELELVLRNHILITPPSYAEQAVINLGATVTVEVGGKLDEFMIVGTLEANPSMGKISNESLVGQALMGKKVGEIVVISNAMRTSYKIKEIRYEL